MGDEPTPTSMSSDTPGATAAPDDVTVEYEWRACIAWKSENTQVTCEDCYSASPERGLFALADGLGMMTNSALWAQILVDQWVAEPPTSDALPIGQSSALTGATPRDATTAVAGVSLLTERDAARDDGDDRRAAPADAPSVLFQFEVEGWLRRAQALYTAQAPAIDERTAIPEAKEKARMGSGSTLLAISMRPQQPQPLDSAEIALDVTCFARGDTTGFLIRQGVGPEPFTIQSFPITDPSQLSAHTTCLRTKSFNRSAEGLLVWRTTLPIGAILLLATDAVTRYLFAALRAHGAQTMAEFATFTDEDWRAHVALLRAQGELIDDDSAFIMIRRLPTDATSASPGWNHARLSQRVLAEANDGWAQRRHEEAQAALARADLRAVARIVGAEAYFRAPEDAEYRAAAARGRRVALAMERLLQGLLALPESTALTAQASRAAQIAQLRALWQASAPILAQEPTAAGLRQTLLAEGVIIPDMEGRDAITG